MTGSVRRLERWASWQSFGGPLAAWASERLACSCSGRCVPVVGCQASRLSSPQSITQHYSPTGPPAPRQARQFDQPERARSGSPSAYRPVPPGHAIPSTAPQQSPGSPRDLAHPTRNLDPPDRPRRPSAPAHRFPAPPPQLPARPLPRSTPSLPRFPPTQLGTAKRDLQTAQRDLRPKSPSSRPDSETSRVESWRPRPESETSRPQSDGPDPKVARTGLGVGGVARDFGA